MMCDSVVSKAATLLAATTLALNTSAQSVPLTPAGVHREITKAWTEYRELVPSIACEVRKSNSNSTGGQSTTQYTIQILDECDSIKATNEDATTVTVRNFDRQFQVVRANDQIPWRVTRIAPAGRPARGIRHEMHSAELNPAMAGMSVSGLSLLFALDQDLAEIVSIDRLATADIAVTLRRTKRSIGDPWHFAEGTVVLSPSNYWLIERASYSQSDADGEVGVVSVRKRYGRIGVLEVSGVVRQEFRWDTDDSWRESDYEYTYSPILPVYDDLRLSRFGIKAPKEAVDRNRAFLGITCIDGQPGCTVAAVLPRSAAADSDLRKDDTILSLDGSEIERFHDLQLLISKHAPGDVVTLKVKRGDMALEIRAKLTGLDVIEAKP